MGKGEEQSITLWVELVGIQCYNIKVKMDGKEKEMRVLKIQRWGDSQGRNEKYRDCDVNEKETKESMLKELRNQYGGGSSKATGEKWVNGVEKE